MNMNNPENWQGKLKVLGYCDASNEFIYSRISQNLTEDLTRLAGEYTIIHETDARIIIITSMIGAMQYFYSYDGKTFLHGELVIDVFKKMKCDWQWDWESVGDLCELENLTENRTLNKNIRRVPPGSVLTFDGQFLLRSNSLIESFVEKESCAVDAVDILNIETKKWISAETFLSLSGGFDSRVILSSMMKQGVYPTVVTLGDYQSSDCKVASNIADRFKLKHIRVTLTLSDLLQKGERISEITNGSKPACHWNTYLYPLKASVPKLQSFFVGTLGEFARSYYFDKGFVSLLAEGFPEHAQRKFWKAKLSRHQTFKPREIGFLNEELVNQLSENGLEDRAVRNAKLSSGQFLSGGAKYYLEQRVPNFYANGIRMYNESSQWRSPFHSVSWLENIWNLNDNWKLGSNWHRLAIKRNFRELLDFPEEKGFSRKKMLSRAPILYWLPQMQRAKYETYDLSADWYCNETIKSLIIDNHSYLDEFITRRLSEDILVEHQNHRTRTKTISFLLTLMYFKMVLAKKG